MENKITIVSTAYNTEKYISRAIQSVIDQTYQDWELIVVDDASTDSTLQIAKESASKDDRIRVIHKVVNEGAGLARRTGIENRSKDSQYLCFLDSDDYLDNDYLKTLYIAISLYDANIVTSGLKVVSRGGGIDVIVPHGLLLLDKENIYFKSENYKDSVFRNWVNGTLTRTSLWDKVQYSERRFAEDTPTLYKLLFYSEKRLILPYAGYNYFQNSNGLCETAKKDWKYFKLYRLIPNIDIATFFKDKNKILYKQYQNLSLEIYNNEVKDINFTKEEKLKYKKELETIENFLG